jgi:hypothetical protein
MKENVVFKIVIAYENFAAGIRAKKMLERLASELQPDFQINSDVWEFEMLGHRRLREQAATEASEADMIVVSARGDAELPAHVKNWVDGWLPQRRGGLTALVALLDLEEKSSSAQSTCAYLRQVAGKGRMDFFCKAGDWEHRDSEYTVEIVHPQSNPPGRVPAFPEDIRYWGINE